MPRRRSPRRGSIPCPSATSMSISSTSASSRAAPSSPSSPSSGEPLRPRRDPARPQGRDVATAMERVLAAFGHPVHTVLTDNGAEFTDRFQDGSKAGHAARPTGAIPSTRSAPEPGSSTGRHVLTGPRPTAWSSASTAASPGDACLAPGTRQFPPPHPLHQPRRARAFLLRFVADYNRTRLRCLGYRAPLDVLHNHTEHNTGGRAAAARARARAGRLSRRAPLRKSGGSETQRSQEPCGLVGAGGELVGGSSPG